MNEGSPLFRILALLPQSRLDEVFRILKALPEDDPFLWLFAEVLESHVRSKEEAASIIRRELTTQTQAHRRGLELAFQPGARRKLVLTHLAVAAITASVILAGIVGGVGFLRSRETQTLRCFVEDPGSYAQYAHETKLAVESANKLALRVGGIVSLLRVPECQLSISHDQICMTVPENSLRVEKSGGQWHLFFDRRVLDVMEQLDKSAPRDILEHSVKHLGAQESK